MTTSFATLAGCRDVFYEILDHIDPGIDDDYNVEDHKIHIPERPSRRTLLSLALCCHAFLDPSLNKLWHSLDDLSPLLSLLPNYQHRIPTNRLVGEISPGAWSRLQTYAQRVRHLHFHCFATDIDDVVWPTIFEQCRGAPLFPNLTAITISIDTTYETLALTRALVSPSLRKAFLVPYPRAPKPIAATQNVATVGMILQEFSMKSPGLVQLSFFPQMTVDYGYLTCFSRFTQVERLYLNDVPVLDPDLLLILANLENLTVLRASVLPRTSTEFTQLNLRGGFPKLTQLNLRCPPIHLEHVMHVFPIAQLNDLSLRLRPHPPDGFDTSLASICRRIPGPHTGTLTRFCAGFGSFTHPPAFLMNALEPLLQFANLEDVQLFTEEHLPLRDEDLARIARAWSKLRCLLLIQSDATLWEPDRVPGSVERPTLRGLVELARGCPLLDRLCVPDLDVSILPLAASVPLLRHGLLDLCIQNLAGAPDDEKQLQVAVVLDRLFPRLELEAGGIAELSDGGDNPNPYLEELESVSRFLRAMQIARTHYPSGI